jgi:UDP-N-acetylglucosamine 3-dehydrogenase
MKRLRVGIMSFAHVHADGYATLLRDHPNVELIGFSEPDPERGRAASSVHGLPWFTTHEALMAQHPDAVIVCCENFGRMELVQLAAAHGAHVLCEKPIEVSLERALAMRDACDAAGVKFMTAFPMRFDTSVLALRDHIRRGDLGRVYGINGVNHSESPHEHRAWFAQKALSGGGAVMDHTVHLVDLYRWFFETEVRNVHAEIGNPFQPHAVDVDTAGLALMTLENEVFASVDCSWSRPSTYPRWGHLKLEVIGERGGVELDAFAQHLQVYSRRNAKNLVWQGWGSDPNAAMLESFFACIRDDTAPAVSWQDGYEALRVALACYDSNERGQPVILR